MEGNKEAPWYADKRVWGSQIRFPEAVNGKRRLELIPLSGIRVLDKDFQQDAGDIEFDAQVLGEPEMRKFRTPSIPLKETFRDFEIGMKWDSIKNHAIAIERTGNSRNTKYHIEALSDTYVKKKQGVGK